MKNKLRPEFLEKQDQMQKLMIEKQSQLKNSNQCKLVVVANIEQSLRRVQGKLFRVMV